MRTLATWVVAAAVLSAGAGCREEKRGDAGPQTFPVVGYVFRGGKPVAGGTVQFVHQTEPGANSLGEIGPDGRFELFTLVGTEHRPGARAGEYKAVIVFTSPAPPAHPRAVFKVDRHENVFKIDLP